MFDVVIRVDSSTQIGSGHVVRCISLACELRDLGRNVSFVCRSHVGNNLDAIRNLDFEVFELTSTESEITSVCSNEYSDWLGVSQRQDAKEFAELIKRCNLVVVDHYALDFDWEEYVKSNVSSSVVAIDDLRRKHSSDVVFDQTLNRTPALYRESSPLTFAFTGSNFCLIKSQFLKFRKKLLSSKIEKIPYSILISFGGIDQLGTTLEVLQCLKKSSHDNLKVTVLLSEQSPFYDSVSNFCKLNKEWVNHIDFTTDMPALMATHQVAIGAPGGTSWERACLGIPSVIIPIAQNQNEVAAALKEQGGSIVLNSKNIEEELGEALDSIRNNLEYFQNINFRTCDGLGVKRVANIVNDFLNGNNFWLSLEKAELSDIDLVYEWQCLEETRRYALNPIPPTYREHTDWMEKKLASFSDFFYIINIGEANQKKPVGVIRLDEKGKDAFVISIFLIPEQFGRGIAKRALNQICNIHSDVNLYATVLADNIASQNLFLSAGFHRISNEQFIRPILKGDIS